MINGFDAYRVFNSMKLHFNQKAYDVSKYGYNPKQLSVQKYETVNGKYQYEKLARKFNTLDDLKVFLVPNIYRNPNMWVTDCFTGNADDIHMKYSAFKKSQQYYVLEQFKYLKNKYGSFRDSLRQHRIIYEIDCDKVFPDTYILLDRCYGIGKFVKTDIPDVIWQSIEMKLNKYGCFVSVPTEQFYEELRHNVNKIVKETAT